MNDLIVDVKLWGESVGSLYWEKESNAALFDYEPVSYTHLRIESAYNLIP